MFTILKLDNISKRYSRRDHMVNALCDISIDVNAGEFKAIRGLSGSGKTTLLLAAGGLLSPDAGTVEVAGRSLYGMSADERAAFRAAEIGYVFQQFHLIPYLSVLENVLAPSLADVNPANGTMEEKTARSKKLVSYLGLADRATHSPSELSTGERQRVALARALLNKPKLLLADEPTGNLDERNAELVIRYMEEFARSGGAVLVVTHSSRIEADEVYELDSGILQRN